jgi:hypothetical protein
MDTFGITTEFENLDSRSGLQICSHDLLPHEPKTSAPSLHEVFRIEILSLWLNTRPFELDALEEEVSCGDKQD